MPSSSSSSSFPVPSSFPIVSPSLLVLNQASSSSTSHLATSSPDVQTELDSFRSNWLLEVRQRNQLQTTDLQPDTVLQVAPSTSTALNKPLGKPPLPATQAASAHLQSPLTIYAQAVYYERIGLLDDALLCYRKAFRLEADVDRAYHLLKPKEVDAIERQFDPRHSQDQPSESSFQFSRPFHSDGEHYVTMGFDRVQSDSLSKMNKGPQSVAVGVPCLSNQDRSAEDHPSSTKGFLRSLIASFVTNPWQRALPVAGVETASLQLITDSNPVQGNLGSVINALTNELTSLEIDDANRQPRFEPLDPDVDCAIRKVPPELLVQILSPWDMDRASVHLIVRSAERFARVSRLARVLTLEPSLWRLICEKTYGNDLFVNRRPEIFDLNARRAWVESLCRKSHANDWRRMYIEQPRIRVDGCFIALVRYPRLGESANPWYTPTHFVTYFRYLRFFPNGTCLSLTSTDEPTVAVRKLQWPSSEMPLSNGVLCGHWSLQDDFVRVFDLQQDYRHLLTGQHDAGLVECKYRFEMHCRLQSTRRGKMNKLDISRLSTLNLTNGEELEIPLSTNESGSKPFIFSRVIAYDVL